MLGLFFCYLLPLKFSNYEFYPHKNNNLQIRCLIPGNIRFYPIVRNVFTSDFHIFAPLKKRTQTFE